MTNHLSHRPMEPSKVASRVRALTAQDYTPAREHDLVADLTGTSANGKPPTETFVDVGPAAKRYKPIVLGK